MQTPGLFLKLESDLQCRLSTSAIYTDDNIKMAPQAHFLAQLEYHAAMSQVMMAAIIFACISSE
eukprot:gene6839-9509_t